MRKAALLAALLAASLAGAEDLPSAATSRKAFEAQFPKQGPSSAALELERLAARLGVDLAPRIQTPPPQSAAEDDSEGDDSEEEPDNPPWAPTPTPTPKPVIVDPFKDRPRPSEEAAKRFAAISSELFDFVTREIKSTEEPVGVPPMSVERFLGEQEPALSSIESLLRSENTIRWEIDVTNWQVEPWPNFMGQMRLQRILTARALLAARGGDMASAGRTLEASWKLIEALWSRPEFIAHLIVVAAAKQNVGAMRKVDHVEPGSPARLRSRRLSAGFLAAFQNQIWFFRDVEDLTGYLGVMGRVYRQMADDLGGRESCPRSADEIRTLWERVIKESLDPRQVVLMEINFPNLLNGLERLGRYEIDAELTALVLDARAERASSSRRLWPEALRTLGQGICPSAKWAYRPSGRTATVAFESPLPPAEVGLQLPLTFTAGPPAAKPSPAANGDRFANLDGMRVRYRVSGPSDRPAIVLVHGWSGSMELWKEQVPALSRRYRVVVLDLPGHGGSDKPERAYTMDLFARAVAAVLDDAGIEKGFLAGHSMGTPVIRQVLRRSPSRVLGLVAVDGALRALSTDPAFVDRFLAPYRTDRWKEAMAAFVDASFPAGKSAAREETKAIMTATPQHVVLSAGEGMFDPEIWTEDEIDVPLLLLLAKAPFWSAEYEAYVRRLARDVDWRVFDGVGHFLMLQKPEEINAALLDWLARRETAAE